MYRGSLESLSPRTTNDNPFRRKWDILSTQRKELLRSLETILNTRSHNLNEDNIEAFNDFMKMYLEILFPEKARESKRKDKDLLKGWENVFKLGTFKVEALDEKSKESKKYAEKFNIKNLTRK